MGLMQRARCVAQVLVNDLDNPQLIDDDTTHLAKSLRVRNGEQVSLIDGQGNWRIGEWQDGEIEAVTPKTFVTPDAIQVTVGMAVLKGERTEWAVQKLTEIGVDRIVLLANTDHGVVRWDAAKREKNAIRLTRVAHEAAMQSRRVRLPKLEITGGLESAPKDAAIAHPGGEPLDSTKVNVMIGPEGGWSESELNVGFETVNLGSTILRSETAAVALGARMCALREA